MFGAAIAYYRLATAADWLAVAVISGVLFFCAQMGAFVLMVWPRSRS